MVRIGTSVNAGGVGAFATCDIKRGTVICPFPGKRVPRYTYENAARVINVGTAADPIYFEEEWKSSRHPAYIVKDGASFTLGAGLLEEVEILQPSAATDGGPMVTKRYYVYRVGNCKIREAMDRYTIESFTRMNTAFRYNAVTNSVDVVAVKDIRRGEELLVVKGTRRWLYQTHKCGPVSEWPLRSVFTMLINGDMILNQRHRYIMCFGKVYHGDNKDDMVTLADMLCMSDVMQTKDADEIYDHISNLIIASGG